MKMFKIPVMWQMYGYVKVMADCVEDATDLAMHEKLPEDADYVEGSFEIDYDGIPEEYAGDDI